MDSEDIVGSNSRQQELWKNGRKGMFFNDFRRDVRDFFGSDFLPVAVFFLAVAVLVQWIQKT